MNNKEFKEKIVECYNNISDILNSQEDLGYDYDTNDKLVKIHGMITEILMELG